jgi:hypothetical protein
VLERLEHRLLGDLVEGDAGDFLGVLAQHLRDVPGDRLALAVRVGRQVDDVRLCAALSFFTTSFLSASVT